MPFLAFVVPWLFLCALASALLALYAYASAGRAAGRVRIEKKAAEGSSEELGRCKWGSYRCEAKTDDECRESEVCTRYGWCTKAEDGCFITR